MLQRPVMLVSVHGQHIVLMCCSLCMPYCAGRDGSPCQGAHTEARAMLGAQAVGGNTALALLLTVGTNLAGIFTMPFVLCRLLDTGSSAVALSPGPLLRSLVKTILVPLLIGAGSRAIFPGQQK